jgi:hypothetical protein
MRTRDKISTSTHLVLHVRNYNLQLQLRLFHDFLRILDPLFLIYFLMGLFITLSLRYKNDGSKSSLLKIENKIYPTPQQLQQ